MIGKRVPLQFTAHQNVQYKIPNTLENLGVELLINGIYEKKLVRFLRKNIRPGDVYFDIGANIGSIGLPVVKNVQGVKYVGFEASPMVFDFLQYNFTQNKMENYELHNCLVHETDNYPMKFYASEQYGKSSLAPTYTEEYIIISSMSLDSFCQEQTLTHINWMKVDVQGYELYVFKGLNRLLTKKKVQNILFEFEYWAEEAAGLDKGAAQRYLVSCGYELFDMNGKKLTAILTEGRAMIWAKPLKRWEG
ncbi:MAG: FkbM family methyltransferase [Ferruginibacter sp.]